MSSHHCDDHDGGGSSSPSPQTKKTKQQEPNSDVAANANHQGTTKGCKLKKRHPEVWEFRQLVQQACKHDDLETAMAAYDKAVEKGIRIEPQSFYNLLNLCDGLGDRSLHIGTPKRRNDLTKDPGANGSDEVKSEHAPDVAESSSANTDTTAKKSMITDEIRIQHAERIHKHMQSLQLPLIETAYTALVRLYARNGRLERALELLAQAETTSQCKVRLRLYAPLLQFYCSDPSLLKQALEMWHRIVAVQKLQLTEKEYASLIRCCCYREEQQQPSKGNDDADRTLIMERILSDVSEDVLVPSAETTQAIADWFQSKHAQTGVDAVNHNSDWTSSMLKQIQIPFLSVPTDVIPLGVDVQHINGFDISNPCRVNPTTGVLLDGCLQGHALRSLELSPESWKNLMDMNTSLATTGEIMTSDNDHATTEFQGGKKGRKRKLGHAELQVRQDQWNHYLDYLDRRKTAAAAAAAAAASKPVDIVIDGANVGYYETNFPNAPKHVNYQQIDSVVEHFWKARKSVLLIMHSRHFANKTMLPDFAKPIVQKWTKAGILFRTPKGANDDWFWLHAALHFGSLVVTNDEMRDHHFQMVTPRSFLKWRERHQIHFELGHWKKDRTREVRLTYPDPYSRRIQRVANGLVIPLPKRGDTNRFLDGVFEADDSAPVEETYLCIRPKQKIDT